MCNYHKTTRVSDKRHSLILIIPMSPLKMDSKLFILGSNPFDYSRSSSRSGQIKRPREKYFLQRTELRLFKRKLYVKNDEYAKFHCTTIEVRILFKTCQQVDKLFRNTLSCKESDIKTKSDSK
jgi:hypothetical protein